MPTSAPVPEKMLSPFQWQLMELVWGLGENPLLFDIHARQCEIREINYNSVNSILKKIEDKGWVHMDRSQGRRHRCCPLFTRDEAIEIEVTTMLDRIEARAPDKGLAMLRERLDERLEAATADSAD